MKKLPVAFYRRPVVEVARDLLGTFLVRVEDDHCIVGRITETEAYDGLCDKACHAYGNRRTKRNEPLFAAGGVAHVYFIYGMYYCLNAVTGDRDSPAAVLIRAIEVVEGVEQASQNRYGQPFSRLSAANQKNLANGPGKLCRALSIDTALDGESLRGTRLYLCDRIGPHVKQHAPIHAAPRIGIDYAEEAKEFPWRFTIV